MESNNDLVTNVVGNCMPTSHFQPKTQEIKHATAKVASGCILWVFQILIAPVCLVEILFGQNGVLCYGVVEVTHLKCKWQTVVLYTVFVRSYK